jgi:uncharacterized protein (TIGR00162 family)
MMWKKECHVKKLPKLDKPVFIEGLPGIGNVGKVTIDFIIDEMKAQKLFSFTSNTLPHSVFVNEKNLVELPSIELYYKKWDKKTDLLLLTGDVQPIDEESCYDFCEMLLDCFQELKGSEIITLGGIGLPTAPKVPKVYVTGNSAPLIKKYKENTKLYSKLYGIVGPIVGVSGLLLGLAEKRKIPAITLLAETMGHPMYLGVKGAKEILEVLNKKLSLKINFKDFNKEIDQMESEILKRSEDMGAVIDKSSLKRFKGKFGDVSYIG